MTFAISKSVLVIFAVSSLAGAAPASAQSLRSLLEAIPNARSFDPVRGYGSGYVPSPYRARGYDEGYYAPQDGGYAPRAANPAPPPPSNPPMGSRADPLMTTDPMHDTSLEPGDSLMTKDGLRVFVGDPLSDPHSPGDFVTPSRAKDYVASSEARRIAIADTTRRAVKVAYGKSTLGRSSSEESPVRGVDIRDARGRTVRYVGP